MRGNGGSGAGHRDYHSEALPDSNTQTASLKRPTHKRDGRIEDNDEDEEEVEGEGDSYTIKTLLSSSSSNQQHQ